MDKKFFFIALVLSTPIHPDATCIGITNVPDLETNVSEQGPVRFFGCPCNCAQYRWLGDTTCIECSHKHAGGITLGNKQLSPEWLEGLSNYVLQKIEKDGAKTVKVSSPKKKISAKPSQDNYYEHPHEGESSSSGGGMLGGAPFGEDSSSANTSATFSTSDPNARTYNYDDYNPDRTDFYQGQSMIQQSFDGPSVGDIGDWDSNGTSSAFNFGM